MFLFVDQLHSVTLELDRYGHHDIRALNKETVENTGFLGLAHYTDMIEQPPKTVSRNKECWNPAELKSH